jgi:ABC-type phosphate/phosphonate transport system substrate-binding protein
VASNHVQSPKFVDKIVFEGKVSKSDVKLDAKTSMLKAVKAVDGGQADAALLSDEDLTWLKTSPFAANVKVVWTSPQLPPMPVVAFGKNSTAKDREAFTKMLIGMCASPDGAKVCKDLDIEKFGPADKAAYDVAMKKYVHP